MEAKHPTFENLATMNANTRKHPADEEHRIQCACVRWFNAKYPQLRSRLFAVPNGGRRDATTAAKLKAEGVVPGVSDLVLLRSNRNHGALLIEMKTPPAIRLPEGMGKDCLRRGRVQVCRMPFTGRFHARSGQLLER